MPTTTILNVQNTDSDNMAYDREKSLAFIQKYGAGEYTVFLCHEE